MKKSLNLDYIKADHIEDLPVADRELIAEAQKATELAYAKYSGFKVGAAVRLQSGKILRAANSESEVSLRACVPSVRCSTMLRLTMPTTLSSRWL